jgi:hypothetical protein
MMKPRYDLNAIKAALPAYLERTGCEPRPIKNGSEITALCPLHADTHASMACVQKKPDLWTWYCHVCSEGGTVIDLHAKRNGIDTAGAIAELGEILNAPFTESAAPSRPSVRPLARGSRTTDADDRIPGLGRNALPVIPPPPKPEPLAGADAELCSGAVKALLSDESARRELAELLGVSPDTLARLAGTLDLGLIDGRLVYLAHDGENWHGCQVRGRPGEKSRFFWKVGKPFLPWRGWRLSDKRVRTVYICEGQSDAIALIDAGIEDASNPASKVAVIAAPGTAFPESWGDLFRFRRVILCGDRDEPGQRAVRKVGELLLPLAESVRVFSWAALPSRCAGAGDIRELCQTLKQTKS